MARKLHDDTAPVTDEEFSAEDFTDSTDSTDEENDDMTETFTEATEPEVAAEVEAPATETDTPAEEPEVDFTEYNRVVEEVLATRDTSTGEIAPAELAKVTSAYRALPGPKPKAAARSEAADKMREALSPETQDIALAFAWMKVQEVLTAGGGGGGTSTSKAPADPTQAYVELVAGLVLANHLATAVQPEGVSEDWETKANELVSSEVASAEALIAHLRGDAEGDEPEASPLARAAVKLALGKSARVSRSTSGGSTGTRTSSGGPRKSTANHIREAFADKEAGHFMKVGEIAAFSSTEYGDDHPSQGAISARLFPDGDASNCKLDFVEPAIEGGVKGARKR
jgi:hypothetical protein